MLRSLPPGLLPFSQLVKLSHPAWQAEGKKETLSVQRSADRAKILLHTCTRGSVLTWRDKRNTMQRKNWKQQKAPQTGKKWKNQGSPIQPEDETATRKVTEHQAGPGCCHRERQISRLAHPSLGDTYLCPHGLPPATLKPMHKDMCQRNTPSVSWF